MRKLLREHVSLEDDVTTNTEVILGTGEIRPEFDQDVEDECLVCEIELAHADATTISSICKVMSENADAGVSGNAAAIATIATEAIVKRLGLASANIVGLEHFESEHSRSTATKVSVESIGDTLKSLFAYIKKIAVMIWQSIRKFTSWVCSAQAKQKRKANREQLTSRIKDIEKNGKGNSKTNAVPDFITNLELVVPFRFNGMPCDVSTVIAISENASKYINAIYDYSIQYQICFSLLKDAIHDYIDTVESCMDGSVMNTNKTYDKVNDAFRSTVDGFIVSAFPKVNMPVFKKGVLRNNILVGNIKTIHSSGPLAFGTQQYFFNFDLPDQCIINQFITPEVSGDHVATMRYLTVDQMSSINKTMDVAGDFFDSKLTHSLASIVNLEKQFFDELAKIEKVVDSYVKLPTVVVGNDDVKEIIIGIQRILQNLIETAQGLSSIGPKKYLETETAINKLVLASIEYYEKGKLVTA